MTDFERNADVVHITAYAPLFAHVEGWQWRPDLIWYDNTRMFKSVSYYVQQLYAQNKGTNVLSLTWNGKPVAGQDGQLGLFASAVYDKPSGQVFIKIANTSDKAQQIDIDLQGMKGQHAVETLSLHSDEMDAENTLDQPERITPQKGSLTTTADKKAARLSDTLPAKTFRLYKVK